MGEQQALRQLGARTSAEAVLLCTRSRSSTPTKFAAGCKAAMPAPGSAREHGVKERELRQGDSCQLSNDGKLFLNTEIAIMFISYQMHHAKQQFFLSMMHHCGKSAGVWRAEAEFAVGAAKVEVQRKRRVRQQAARTEESAHDAIKTAFFSNKR